MNSRECVIGTDDPILITGAAGFIGSKLVATLVRFGFTNLCCFVRSSGNSQALQRIASNYSKCNIRILTGNLLSREDCKEATKDIALVFHLVAGFEKSFPGCYLNSVVTTRNLLECFQDTTNLKRFVNVSSIAVYSNRDVKRYGVLDEKSEVDSCPEVRYEAYVYGKVKQDELVLDYARKYRIPYVIVRPGDVFGPGKKKISGRVGITSFGVFLHLGGRAQVPLTYIDNCAEAIALAGIKKGIDGEVFNIVDSQLPTSRFFLRMYKKNVGYFKSIYLPYGITYLLCYFWEKYSVWSRGQLPPAFNRRKCIGAWKRIRYSNKKAIEILGWQPRVTMNEALNRYFAFMKESGEHND